MKTSPHKSTGLRTESLFLESSSLFVILYLPHVAKRCHESFTNVHFMPEHEKEVIIEAFPTIDPSNNDSLEECHPEQTESRSTKFVAQLKYVKHTENFFKH